MTKATVVTALTAPVVKSPSKSALVVKLLCRTKGATIAEIQEPTGWKPHSTRAYLSGLRRQGRSVVREQRKSGETAYRIVDAAILIARATGMFVADAPPSSSDSRSAGASVEGVTDNGAPVAGSAISGAIAATNSVSS